MEEGDVIRCIKGDEVRYFTPMIVKNEAFIKAGWRVEPAPQKTVPISPIAPIAEFVVIGEENISISFARLPGESIGAYNSRMKKLKGYWGDEKFNELKKLK